MEPTFTPTEMVQMIQTHLDYKRRKNEAAKAYYEANKEACKLKSKLWYDKNKERIAAKYAAKHAT